MTILQRKSTSNYEGWGTKIGDSYSGVGVKPGVDSNFDQLELESELESIFFWNSWNQNWSRSQKFYPELELEPASRLSVQSQSMTA